ncbi:MAG: hypothetical protein ACRC46_03085 [Thermoguttaceae bacterium]
MTIQIRCSQCARLLELPDEAAGQRSLCPFCQNVQIVPEAVVNDGVSNTADSVPQTFSFASQPSFMQPMTLRQRLTVGNLFSETWRVYWHQLGLMVVLALIAIVPPMLVTRCLIVAGVDVSGFKLEVGETIIDAYTRLGTDIWLIAAQIVFAICWQLWVWLGSLRMVLHLVRTGEVRWSLFFSPLSLIVRMAATWCAVMLIVMGWAFVVAFVTVLIVGLVMGLMYVCVGGNDAYAPLAIGLRVLVAIPLGALCLAILLWVNVRLSMWMFYIIDGSGVIESISRSWRVTRGVVWPLVVAFICLGLLTVAINMATLAAGSIFLFGFSYTLMATIYCHLIGRNDG